jgi:hypothetical protein
MWKADPQRARRRAGYQWLSHRGLWELWDVAIPANHAIIGRIYGTHMEHIGKKVFLAVAQQPFEVIGESGFLNSFATLVPLLTAEGEILDPSEFRHYGMVFWMVWQRASRFAEPGRLLVGKLEHTVTPGRLEYQLAPDSADVVQPSDLIEVLTVDHPDVREPRDFVNIESVLVLDHPPTSLVLARW